MSAHFSPLFYPLHQINDLFNDYSLLYSTSKTHNIYNFFPLSLHSPSSVVRVVVCLKSSRKLFLLYLANEDSFVFSVLLEFCLIWRSSIIFMFQMPLLGVHIATTFAWNTNRNFNWISFSLFNMFSNIFFCILLNLLDFQETCMYPTFLSLCLLIIFTYLYITVAS